ELWSIVGEESGDPVLVRPFSPESPWPLDKLCMKIFTRRFTTQETEMFVAKSQRISRLTLPKRIFPWIGEEVHKAEFLRVAPEAYEKLRRAALDAGRVLFPNLVSITVLDSCSELEPLYDHFGPSLLDVNINLNLYMSGSRICETFLDRLRRNNQFIQFLNIELAPPEVLRDIICTLPNLERLKTQSSLTAESLRHLSGLNTLKNLTCEVNSIPLPSELFSTLTFEALQLLSCQCANVDCAILLLSMISHCHLTHLEIGIMCHGTFSTRDDGIASSPLSAQKHQARQQKWNELVRAVSKSDSRTSLISLRIQEHVSNPWGYDVSPLELDSIGPLLAFKSLCELGFHAASGISVKDRDLDILLQHLPRLKKMNIQPPFVRTPTDQEGQHTW
ncbi:hypothetical protein C0993_007618, partial [Termitomyces sp. T159_Od127]